MTKTVFKKAILTTIAAATLATSTLTITTSANAGKRDILKGLAAGVVAGAVVGALHNRAQQRQPEVVYVEPRQPLYEPRPVVADGHAWSDAQHTRWCQNRYRSYDYRSDTYQPFRGPRQYCNSPYN